MEGKTTSHHTAVSLVYCLNNTTSTTYCTITLTLSFSTQHENQKHYVQKSSHCSLIKHSEIMAVAAAHSRARAGEQLVLICLSKFKPYTTATINRMTGMITFDQLHYILCGVEFLFATSCLIYILCMCATYTVFVVKSTVSFQQYIILLSIV